MKTNELLNVVQLNQQINSYTCQMIRRISEMRQITDFCTEKNVPLIIETADFVIHEHNAVVFTSLFRIFHFEHSFRYYSEMTKETQGHL